jgi:hypothetical protein
LAATAWNPQQQQAIMQQIQNLNSAIAGYVTHSLFIISPIIHHGQLLLFGLNNYKLKLPVSNKPMSTKSTNFNKH